ncbi:M42 family metallopeptidase [Microvirga sp. W0021]|uniref:M42 family metallopeptidase n=1 Tax=Hohaiivirga grylli TaxID=3133970 RepID=A0ABV0BFJ4_9HYPH
MDRNDVKQSLKTTLKELTSIIGVSGAEQDVVRAMIEKLKPYADSIEVTTLGNLTAVKKGNRPGPTILVAAHSDEIGLAVKYIGENGFIGFDKIGGVPDNLLVGRKVWISSKKIPGVIGAKPGHLLTAEEARTVRPARELYIDVACSSAEEVAALGIRVGDRAVFADTVTEMGNGDYIAGRAIDNRAGCSVICEVLRQCASGDFAGTLVVGATCREEVGMVGAGPMGHKVKPDYVLAIDTVPSGDTPDQPNKSLLPIALGKGPAVLLADGCDSAHQYGIFSSVHPAIRKAIEKQSAAQMLPVQWLTLVGFLSTTDASVYAYAGDGIPEASFTIPRRYSHSPVEMLNINDMVDMVSIIKGIVEEENETINLDFLAH